MMIGEAVAGNRVAYNPTGGYIALLGYVVGTNGPLVQVAFDRDLPVNAVTEVNPSFLSLSTDGGYLGDTQGAVITSTV